jgi:hypothetical protein
MINSGLHCAMCTKVWWFTDLCAHIFLYFNSTIILDGQIAIVDFGIDCKLDFTMIELANDESIFLISNIFQ